jgi:hypothetical protein
MAPRRDLPNPLIFRHRLQMSALRAIVEIGKVFRTQEMHPNFCRRDAGAYC